MCRIITIIYLWLLAIATDDHSSPFCRAIPAPESPCRRRAWWTMKCRRSERALHNRSPFESHWGIRGVRSQCSAQERSEMTERNYPRNRVIQRYRRLLLKAGAHENMIKPGGGGDNEASTTNQRASCRFRKGTKGVRIIPMELRLFPEACCKQTPRAPRHAPSHVVYSKRLRSCTVQSCSDQLASDLQMPTTAQTTKKSL
jgi:hypothetical protein